jgi:hypothetical protein
MTDPADEVREEFPRDTSVEDLGKEAADRLRDGAVSVRIEDRGTKWVLVTDWGDV